MKRHPDERFPGFNPDHGWCVNCDTVLRVIGSQIRWWGSDGYGPFCALSCMRRCGSQGTLLDHVSVKLPPETEHVVPPETEGLQ